MPDINKMLREADERSKADTKRFEELDMELCMACHDRGPDMRSLFVNCLYAVHEVVDEAIDLSGVEGKGNGYYLRVCKSCRGAFLGTMSQWWEERKKNRGLPMDGDGVLLHISEDLVPIRVNGAIAWKREDDLPHERNS